MLYPGGMALFDGDTQVAQQREEIAMLDIESRREKKKKKKSRLEGSELGGSRMEIRVAARIQEPRWRGMRKLAREVEANSGIVMRGVIVILCTGMFFTGMLFFGHRLRSLQSWRSNRAWQQIAMSENVQAVEGIELVRRQAPEAPATTLTGSTLAATASASTTAAATGGSSPAASSTGVLQVFGLSPPMLGPNGVLRDGRMDNTTIIKQGSEAGGGGCSVTLMEFGFADSFGKPFVGNYTPPGCIGTSNTVIMNFTVTSTGTQFDRLAVMYLGDTEVWRTSTAEPKLNGIQWTQTTDMSHLLAMWKLPQKVIFDLPNQVTTNLTGAYNTTLTASFFNAEQAVNPASVIIPISQRLGINASMPSVFTLPAQNATNSISSFPRNANRAVVSLSTTGQGNEEFWWSNVLQSDVATYNFSGGALFGFSPFREVQLTIDGQMAGVQWPFPVIFTGGVAPAFWSPMVGIDAFDLKESEIDISPWLPILCDGNAHTFSINVVGLDDGGNTTATLSKSVGSSWLVTGKIFIWTDDEGQITTGNPPTIDAGAPTIAVSQALTKNSTGANDTLSYTISVQRNMKVSSTITTQNGTLAVSWSQNMTHTDDGKLLSGGNVQTNIISTSGKDVFVKGLETPYVNEYSYPLVANSTGTQFPNGSTSFAATLQRGKTVDITGQGSVYPSGLQVFAAIPASSDMVQTVAGTTYTNSQNGTAFLLLMDPAAQGGGNGSVSFGTTSQVLRFGGKSAQGVIGMEPDEELWFKSVSVANGTVRTDTERLAGQGVNSELGQ